MKLALNLILILCFVNFSSQTKKNTNRNEILVLKKNKKNSKYAYYNSKGIKVIGDYWYAKDETLKKFAIVSDPNPVLIDRNGIHIYNIFIFDNGPDYEKDGFIRIVKNGKIGYINSTNYNLVIKPLFKCAYPFENGKAKVSNDCETIRDGEYSTWKSTKWFYINKKGEKINN